MTHTTKVGYIEASRIAKEYGLTKDEFMSLIYSNDLEWTEVDIKALITVFAFGAVMSAIEGVLKDSNTWRNESTEEKK